MSKLIEALKASTKGDLETKKSEYDLIQEQLADVYLGAAKDKKPDQPIIIKVIERPAFPSLIPWIIASIAFLITAFSLFSTKRVFVDIHVLDEKSPLLSTLRGEEAGPSHRREEAPEPASGLPLRGASFEGAAKLKSAVSGGSMTLVNSSVAPFARASLKLHETTNLSGYKITFQAKGARGGENLGFALKDRNNVLAFGKGKIFPFPTALTTEWQRAEITMHDTLPEFDERAVAGMRFEFGSNVGNQPGDTVIVKDLRITPL